MKYRFRYSRLEFVCAGLALLPLTAGIGGALLMQPRWPGAVLGVTLGLLAAVLVVEVRRMARPALTLDQFGVKIDGLSPIAWPSIASAEPFFPPETTLHMSDMTIHQEQVAGFHYGIEIRLLHSLASAGKPTFVATWRDILHVTPKCYSFPRGRDGWQLDRILLMGSALSAKHEHLIQVFSRALRAKGQKSDA